MAINIGRREFIVTPGTMRVATHSAAAFTKSQSGNSSPTTYLKFAQNLVPRLGVCQVIV